MDDLLSEFLTETSEALAVLDVELVKFEQDPSDSEILGNIFRLVHTIKGTCGFLGLPRLESVAHAGENILGKIRDGVIEVTPDAVTLILKCLDAIRLLLEELEEKGEEPEGEDLELIAELNAMADGTAAPSPEPAAEPAPETEAAPEAKAEAEAAGDAGPQPTNEFGAPVAQDLLDEVIAAEAEGSKAATDVEMKAEMATENEAGDDGTAVPAVAAPAANTKEEPMEETKAPAKVEDKAMAKENDAKTPKESSVAASSIRVHVDVLEDLMTQVSELVLTRNQLLQLVRGRDQDD